MSTLDDVINHAIKLIKEKKIEIVKAYYFSEIGDSEHTRLREWLQDKTTSCCGCIISALLLGTMLDSNNEDIPMHKLSIMHLPEIIKHIAKMTEIPPARLARCEMFFERGNGFYQTGDYGILEKERQVALDWANTHENPLERFVLIMQNLRSNKTFDAEKLVKDTHLDQDLKELLG